MKKIAIIGEIVVEIMADETGNGFLEPIALTGPFPSGAPAIFASQAARMGQPTALISAVGDDDFGRINLQRLRQDGVDLSAIHIDADRPTGSAFVRYREDGSRDFVFNIKHSACGTLARTSSANEVLNSCDHLHVMGSSLSSPDIITFNIEAAEALKARGGSLSFDPNLRKEILNADGMREAMRHILKLTDLYLPSGDELTLLTDKQDSNGAIRELLDAGITAIVHKSGAHGARYHDSNGMRQVAAFAVDEIDPTGAGDCFGAAFTTLWLRGHNIDEAMRYAAAAGALAVTRRGPMEGASDQATLERFIAANSGAN